MKRKKSWFQQLTKKERSHVRWAFNGAMPGIKRFKQSRSRQKATRRICGGSEPCWDCWAIENKLKGKGLWNN